jgi:N-carbamoyl-L-amino-acid hydrolase
VSDGPAVDAARVIADLRELDRRTGGPDGAQRLCWGEGWRAARSFLGELLAGLDLEGERDEAGNLWAGWLGDGADAVVLGSHLDSVPAGGWLDGALGVMAALGVMRAWSSEGRPPRGLALVDFADEEGARFGRSLFGSSCVAGTFDPAELPQARELLAENGIALERAPAAARRREGVGAFLELHIEQGPVLEAAGLPCAAVTGTFGVERHRFVVRGQAAHAGTTPMESRRDAFLAAAEGSLAVERIAAVHGGVGTVGQASVVPGIPTAVAGEATVAVDLRHPEPSPLAAMLETVRSAFAESASRRGCVAEAEPIWAIEPTPFDPALVVIAREACGTDRTLASGALHDAAEMARHVPTVMVFAPSKGGISHAKEEDTDERDLARAIEAFGRLANAVLAR